MEETVPFGSGPYFLFAGLLAFARGMDFLSTWVATPGLVLEGNPIAKKMGWKWGIAVSVIMSAVLGLWPMPAIVISTTSILVAARNFQSAWLMRSMGEEAFRDWHVARLLEARLSIFLLCLAGQTLLTASVGAALMWSGMANLVAFSIGFGIVAYAVAVAFYTLLATWRMRRGHGKIELPVIEESAKAESKENHVLTHT